MSKIAKDLDEAGRFAGFYKFIQNIGACSMWIIVSKGVNSF